MNQPTILITPHRTQRNAGGKPAENIARTQLDGTVVQVNKPTPKALAHMKANRHIAGSYVTVFADPIKHGDGYREQRYVDARKDVRHPDTTHIEVVRAGFVRHRESVANERAPERIIELARLLAKGERF